MLRYLLLIVFLCSQVTNLQAQRVNKRILQVRKQLNNFELDKAIRNIDDLIKSYPNEPYYKDLKVYAYKQIISRINYAKEIVQDEDLLQDEIDEMSGNNTEPLDAIDSLEMGLYPKKQTPDIQKEVKKDTVQTKSKKKKRKFMWTDDESQLEEEKGSVSIDSSLIKDENAAVSNDAKEVEAKDNDTYTSRDAKRAAKAAKRAQEILHGYAAMDAKFYKSRIIDEARRFSLMHQHVDSCNQYLFDYLIDTNRKLITSDTIIDLIDNGDEAFANNEFELALTQYHEANILAEAHTDINFRMALVYDKLGEDSLVDQYFKAIKIMDPENSEVIYKIGQFYFQRGDYKKAVTHALQALYIYPHSKYFILIQACAGKTATDFNSQWIPRKVAPINGTLYIDKLVPKTNPWFWYQAAKQRYGGFCNTDCTIKPNDSTHETYLEVAAWLNMLDSSSNPEEFKFAKQIRKVGYLDCYVLISLYHVDLFSQFKHLVTHKPEKVRAYFELLFDWDRPRFDKFKKIEAPIVEDKKKKKKK